MPSMAQAGPSDPLALLVSLPLSHPSFLDLLSRVPTPLLASKSLSKITGRLNACLLGSAGTVSAVDKAIGWRAVECLVDKDESLVVDYGKGWLDAAMAAVTAPDLPVSTVLPAINLLKRLVLVSSRYPSFERENVQPLMGKLAVSLSRLLGRAASDGDLGSLMVLLEATKAILVESPAPFRASTPTLRSILRAIIFNLALPSSAPSSSILHQLGAPPTVKMSAADLLAHLHLTAGKSQASTVWASDMRDSLSGLSYAIDGFVQDAYVEERRAYTSPPSGVQVLPSDPAQRVTVALDLIDGYTEIITALLNVSTTRPVQLPLSNLVNTALRCLNLTLESPIAKHVSPLHQALLMGRLPRLWTAGVLLCGSSMTASGDHLLPHLSNILDHTIFLLEQMPVSMTPSALQLLSFHYLYFALYAPALVPVDYTTRLLKFCLARSGALLEKRDAPAPMTNGIGGKRGRKRARGAEDGLIGSLEGREARPISAEDANVILACLRLVPVLHATPLLPPTLLTLSIRLHLSLYLRLSSLAPSAFAQSSNLPDLTDAVASVLEEAAMMTENQNGTSKGWKTVILSLLPSRGDKFSTLLHPAVPPMIRPQPPLSALHYLAPESDEEKKLRLNLGFGRLDDSAVAEDEMEDVVASLNYNKTLPAQSLPGAVQANSFGAASAPSDSTHLKTVPTQNVVNSALSLEASHTTSIPPPELSVANAPITHLEPMDVDISGPVAGSSSNPSPLNSQAFISHGGVGKAMAAPTATTAAVGTRPTAAQDDDDEPIPELDSGSSIGFASDDDEDED